MRRSLGLALDIRTILGNVAWKGLSVPFEKACRAAIVIVAAPALGPGAFGGYQYAGTVAALLGIATELGLGIMTTRSLARDRARGPAIVAATLRLRTWAGALFLVLAAAVAAWPGGARGGPALLMLLAIGTLLNAYVDYFAAVFRGYERFDDEAVLNVARAVATMVGGLLALRASSPPSAVALAIGLGLGAAASAALGVVMLARRGYLELRRREREGASSPRERQGVALGATLREALPLWLAGLLSTVYFRGDIILLEVLAGEVETGFYGAAYRIFEALMIVPSVVSAVMFPRLVRLYGGPEGARLERMLGAALLGVGAVLGGGLYLTGGWLLALLFRGGFARALPALDVLAAAAPALSLNYALSYVLFARGRERAYLAVVAAMIPVNVVSNLILVPRAGGRGAAWATLLTEALLAVGLLAVLRVGRERKAGH